MKIRTSDAAFKRFESHPIILRIIENVYMTAFTFNTITLEDVELEIRKMNPNKASASNSITVRNFKANVDICGPFIHHTLNHAILGCTFLNKLKLADIAKHIKKTIRLTIGTSVCYQRCPKHVNG